MRQPILLYSTNTWLAYHIAQQYYDSKHYVWCTPYLGLGSNVTFESTVPPTSSPLEIYRILYQEVKRGDKHSAMIDRNRAGILRGASLKQRLGVITPQKEMDIAAIVDLSERMDFRPLLYVIPYALVRKLVKEVPVSNRAHPLSKEYIIEELPRRCFDVIDFNI